MNLLTVWLKALHDHCRLKLRYQIVDKDTYRREAEELNKSIRPTVVPEFAVKGVSLGEMEGELQSNYIKANFDNAGYRQPHEYILYRVEALIEGRYLLAFCSAYTNWPIGRIVMLDECNNIIRNDFRTVYDLIWKDYNDGKYQPKAKVFATSRELR